MLLKWVLHLEFLVVDGYHDAYVVVTHLAKAEIQAAKSQSSLVYVASKFECKKEFPC